MNVVAAVAAADEGLFILGGPKSEGWKRNEFGVHELGFGFGSGVGDAESESSSRLWLWSFGCCVRSSRGRGLRRLGREAD
jgi:hypothetical protein